MSVYEQARHYYQDFSPPLWDNERLKKLVSAGKITIEEYEEITEEKYSIFG